MTTAFSSNRSAIAFFIFVLSIGVSTLHINQFYYSHDTPKWWLFDIVISIINLLLLAHLPSLKPLKILYIPILTIISISLISLAWAPNIGESIIFIYRFSSVCLFIYLFSQYNLNLEQLILDIILISALAFLSLFILERHILDLPYNVGSFSPIGFMNNSGHVFNIWIPLLAYRVFKDRANSPLLIINIITLLGLVSVLMEAGTRGSILGLIIGELFIFFLVLIRQPKQAMIFLSITASLATGITLYSTIDDLKGGRISNRISQFENNIRASTGNRLEMFSNTIEMAREHPLGVGANNFEFIHPKFAKAGTDESSPFINDRQVLTTPHNFLLKMTSELGFIGGLAFLALFILIGLQALYSAWKGELLDRWILISYIAVMFHAQVSGVFLNAGSLWFSALLIALILKRGSLFKISSVLNINATYLKPIAYLLALLSISIGSLLCASKYSAHQGRIHSSLEATHQALKLNPYNERAWFDLSFMSFSKDRDLNQSLYAIEQFLSLYPYHIRGLMIKSERLYQLKRYDEALANTELLLEIYPPYQRAQSLKLAIIKNIDNQ